jgi:ABC-type glycerol-3-phosphate transport system substrate-binding protein
MTGTYRAVMLTKRGGPEVLQVVELPVEQPGAGQLRVRVRAAGVGSTDLIMLAGSYMYAPKIPFGPGYGAEDLRPAVGGLPDMLPTLVQNDTVKGKLVAVPYFTEVSLLYYRSGLVQKYHFTQPRLTWSELERQARTIKNGERANGNNLFWGYLWQGGVGSIDLQCA